MGVLGGASHAWRFINYILNILEYAYQEFEERVGQIAEPRGAKAELIRNAVRRRAILGAPFEPQ